MPNTRLYYRTFNGGEIAPQMTGRIDDVKFQSGVATMRNAIALPHGPATRRSGTTFLNTTKANGVARLIPFQVGVQASYVMEIGGSYIRWHLQGSPMPALAYAWRDKTAGLFETLSCAAANAPWLMTWTNHGLVNGERIRVTDPALASGNLTTDTDYYVINATTNTFNISATRGGPALNCSVAASFSAASGLVVWRRYVSGEAVAYSGVQYYCRVDHNADSSVGTPNTLPATWYAMPTGIYEMPAPYAASDVFELRYVQSNDVLTIVHPEYAPQEIRRIGDTEFSLYPVTFSGNAQPPSEAYVQATAGERIKISQISAAQDHLDCSVQHFFTTGQSLYVFGMCPDGAVVNYRACTFAASAGVWVVTLLGHRYANGDAVHFAATTLPSNIGANSAYYVRNSNVSASTFELGTSITAATSVASGAVTGTAVTGKRLNGPQDGFYVTDTGTSSGTTIIKIRSYDTSTPWTTSETVPWSTLNGYVQYATQTIDLTNAYQITSVDDVNQESLPTEELTVANNLFVPGASNTLLWMPVSNATRYNVYKRQGSLFGYIGQTDQAASLQRWSKWAMAAAAADQPWRIGIVANNSDFVYIDHGFENEDAIKFTAVGGAAILPTGISATTIYYVRVVTSTQFEISLTKRGPSITTTVVIGWTPGQFVGCQKLQSFVDDNIAPDMAQSPPLRDAGELVTSGQYPGAVTYYEQRRCFAGSVDEPQTIYMTRSNTESDLAYSIPSRDDDRIKFKVAAREANTITHMVPLGQLVMLTDSSEWRVTSVNSDALTPTSVSVQPQSYTGSSVVTPKVINNSLLFCASRGGHVRELAYNWQAQGFMTGDLSQRANHLFDGLTIQDMTHQKAPYPVVWFVSSNGKLLGLTYVPEEQVSAWHQHDTAGIYESVCCIPEGNEDGVYVIVNRGTVAAPVRCVEKMAPWKWQNLRDACHLDSSLIVDGRNTTATTMTVSGAAYTVGSTVTLTATGQFQAPPITTDVGDYVIVEDAVGNEYPILITATASANSATGTLFAALPAALQATATTAWGWARNTFSGLAHLEGKPVYAFGGLVSTTYSQGPFTVTGGSVTLGTPLYRGHIGLGFTTDLVTLPAAMQIDGFGQGRTKNVVNSWIKVEQTAGVEIGSDASNLVKADPYANPLLPTVTTNEIGVQLTPTWQNTGQVLIRQTEPLPMTVIGLTLEASIGG